MNNDLRSAYDSAATMRRSMAMLQAEMHEFQIAAAAPRDEAAMERARNNAHAYLDAYLDAMSASMVKPEGR